MLRDDVYEYSLDHHHNEEEGKKKRAVIWKVFWLLLVVTIVEVGLGFKFSRTPEAKSFLLITFITLTIVKAFYIVMSYMHLGDEKKSFRWTVLAPFILFALYLIFICLTEAVYGFKMDQLFNWW
jgi:cytochrome c oxidase subunit IV